MRVLEVGEGVPVLFVHGASSGGSSWAPLVACLSGFRCILLDRPGFGLSPRLNEPLADIGRLEAFVGTPGATSTPSRSRSTRGRERPSAGRHEALRSVYDRLDKTALRRPLQPGQWRSIRFSSVSTSSPQSDLAATRMTTSRSRASTAAYGCSSTRTARRGLDDVEYATLGTWAGSTTAGSTARSPTTTPTSCPQTSKPATTVKQQPQTRRSPNRRSTNRPSSHGNRGGAAACPSWGFRGVPSSRPGASVGAWGHPRGPTASLVTVR